MQPISGIVLAKIVDSGSPKFKVGDLVWGMAIGWEEYSLITNPKRLIKIEHTDVPLSYYLGILGMLCEIVCSYLDGNITRQKETKLSID